MRTGLLRLIQFAVVLAMVLAGPPAGAETINCTAVTSIPAVITVPGIYCLTGNLSTNMTSGNAIEIQTNNVVLDLNGHKLGGLAAGPSTGAIGIFATGRQNITLKNGTVRGFYTGIQLLDTGINVGASQGHVVEDIRADFNTQTAIQVEGRGNLVQNNQVVKVTGGSAGVFTYGISVAGVGPQVLNNDLIDVNLGIFFYNAASGGMAVNNRITNTVVGGINYGGGSTGKYRDNLTFDVPTPYSGGTDAGNNN